MNAQTWLDLLVLLLASLVGVLIIFFYCRYYFRGVPISRTLDVSLIPAGLLATIIFRQSADWPGISLMMIIIFGFIHFRSVVKDTTDVLFVLWAIVSGLFIGAGYAIPTLVADVVIGMGGMIMVWRRSARVTYLLLVRYESKIAESLMDILRPLHGRIRSQINRNGMIDLTIEIHLHYINLTLVDKLNAMAGVHNAVMINNEGNDPI